jgi:hypothetical protein
MISGLFYFKYFLNRNLLTYQTDTAVENDVCVILRAQATKLSSHLFADNIYLTCTALSKFSKPAFLMCHPECESMEF